MRILAVFLIGATLAAQPPKLKLWSLQPVVKPAVPPLTVSKNPIDAFLAVEHKAKGITPNGPADKLTLLRRVSFDITGLPPTPAEQDAFLADDTPGAYDKVIDRLLVNEQHGVRWARHWLDVLRYADLDGLDGSVMPAAPGIFRWRDWMIQALNQDMPYDQFVSAQILGNRDGGRPRLSIFGTRTRPESNPADAFALGFLARSALNGGDRNQEIAMNAVETISSAFMGMTVGCAKCHDHRFDPIKQTDYYAMKAIFDPLVLRKIDLATPQEIYANGAALEAYRRAKEPIDKAVDALAAPYYEKLYAERVAMLPPDVRAIVLKPDRKRTIAEQKTADDYFPVLRIDPPKIKEIMPKAEIVQYDALLKQQGALRRPAGLPAHWIVEEDSARRKQPSYILTSGDPARPEKDNPVKPGFPFQPADIDFRDGLREGFVSWLTGKENPLFARVAVNRIWQWHFGEGLQKASSDFGLLGGRPSHPKLLDYLAAEFADNNFSMRRLHRMILTSDAYKMSSMPSAVNLKADPANTYMWRFRLQRLEAEPLWDDLIARGAVPCGLGARDTLRLEAAMPLYGHELTESIDPLQAGLGWAVKLDKGPFLGREGIQKAANNPLRPVRVGLELDGKRAARETSPVHVPNGGPVGTVTSGSYVPFLQKSIAMAYVDPTFGAIGTKLTVDARGTAIPATVVPLPFYKRTK